MTQLWFEKRQDNTEVLKLLWDAENAGHVFVEAKHLPHIEGSDKQITIDGDNVYLRPLYLAETGIANIVSDMVTDCIIPAVDPPRRPTEGVFLPSDEQWAAIESAFCNKLTLIQGLPGTGKTTLIKLLLDLIDTHPAFKDSWAKYKLAAPTGKAARRLTEATGRQAETIHRLLGYNPKTGFSFNQRRPIQTDFLIIDESSMIDYRLGHALMKAIHPDTRILFIGDADQLPPVRAGQFFEQLLEADVIPTVHLTQIFRQAAKSLIIQNAHRIISGKMPYLSPDEAVRDLVGVEDLQQDFHFIEKRFPLDILQYTVSLVSNQLPAEGYDPIRDILVLAPMKKGIVGLESLNNKLQEQLNITGSLVTNEGFRIGDRIIQTKNDYDTGIMNGELAIIEDMEYDQGIVTLNFGTRIQRVPVTALKTFLLGYAISVHRSQGSQAPVVISIFDKRHKKMISRKLINTAITRAQLLSINIGQFETVENGIRQINEVKPNSLLSRRIKELV